MSDQDLTNRMMEYNMKMMDSFFGKITLAASEATCGIPEEPENAELARDKEIEARQEQREEDARSRSYRDEGDEFESECGARP